MHLLQQAAADDWLCRTLRPNACFLQEDLCLMTVAEDGALRFVSGAVLFPQRWSLAEKLGMDMRCGLCKPHVADLSHYTVCCACLKVKGVVCE